MRKFVRYTKSERDIVGLHVRVHIAHFRSRPPRMTLFGSNRRTIRPWREHFYRNDSRWRIGPAGIWARWNRQLSVIHQYVYSSEYPRPSS